MERRQRVSHSAINYSLLWVLAAKSFHHLYKVKVGSSTFHQLMNSQIMKLSACLAKIFTYNISVKALRTIHYIKGAFVLKMLSDLIGLENFLEIYSIYLKIYILIIVKMMMIILKKKKKIMIISKTKKAIIKMKREMMLLLFKN